MNTALDFQGYESRWAQLEARKASSHTHFVAHQSSFSNTRSTLSSDRRLNEGLPYQPPWAAELSRRGRPSAVAVDEDYSSKFAHSCLFLKDHHLSPLRNKHLR